MTDQQPDRTKHVPLLFGAAFYLAAVLVSAYAGISVMEAQGYTAVWILVAVAVGAFTTPLGVLGSIIVYLISSAAVETAFGGADGAI